MTQSLANALAQALRPTRQIRFAAEQALNDTLFAARKAVQVAMPQVFDRPTPFVISGVKVTTPRSIRDLSAVTESAGLGAGKFGGELVGIVSIDDFGRGKGPAPERVLRAEVAGGLRGFKGAERRLQAAGLMRPGQYMVPSRELLEQGDLVDAFGNVRGPFIRSLLSYLQAFNTPGFTANAKKSTLDRIAGKRRSETGFLRINGVQYFVSKGPNTVNASGRKQHLPAGIWAKRGTGGAIVYPVFLFVNAPQYRVRLRFEDIVSNVANQQFAGFFSQRVANAFATAR